MGVLVVLILIVLAVIFVPKIIEKEKEARRAAEREAEYEERRRKEEEAEREKERRRAEWVQTQTAQFKSSQITKEIIRAISDGSGRKPEKIVITSERVTGFTNGITRVYNFAANGLPKLTFYDDAYQSNCLAQAINQLMGGVYSISLERFVPEVHRIVDCTMELRPTRSF